MHFIERERYYTVDINEYESLMAPFRRYPDTVYHLAAQVGRRASEVNQCHTLETNVIGTYNVCKYCYEYDARLVYAGTSESYGNMLDSSGDVFEIDALRNVRHNTMYGLSKQLGEQVVMYYHDRYGMDAVLLRYIMCYGKERPSVYRSAMVRFIDAALKDEPIYVHRNTSRAWCHVSDTVEATICVGESSLYDLFNVGRDDWVEMVDLAKMVVEMVDSKSEVVVKEKDDDIYRHKKIVCDKIRNKLKWEPRIDLAEGMRMEIEFQKERNGYYD